MKTEFKGHGYYQISNHGGYELELNYSNDAARIKYFDKVSRWQEIKHDNSGDPYVTYYGRKLMLSNFMLHSSFSSI